jgi:hypothetical protein
VTALGAVLVVAEFMLKTSSRSECPELR